MASSYKFYRSLGLQCTFGGSSASFTTFGSSGGPGGGDNSFHVNIFHSSSYLKPETGKWNEWGRAILYVNDVDAVYHTALRHGLSPEAAPADAPWGERYFQILDPMGHELALSRPLGNSPDAPPVPGFESINAVTLATNDMEASYSFYSKLSLSCTYGGPSAEFTTFGSKGGPAGGDNSFHINVFMSTAYKRPAGGTWNGWGRAIFYVDDVDEVYQHVLQQGLKPEAAPANASWGERYFQILDPMGHELTIAKPLTKPLKPFTGQVNEFV